MADSKAQQLTSSVDLARIDSNIKEQKASKAYAIRDLIASTQNQLEVANNVVTKAEALAEPWKVSKKIVGELLAPVRNIVTILDAFSDVHPAVKVVVGVVKVVVQMELQRHDNDKQIAVVYFTMTSTLFLLTDLDPLFQDEQELQNAMQYRLQSICDTINDFGNFCDVYYRTKAFIKTLKSGSMKDKLAGYVASFADHKKELHLLLTSQSSLKVNDIQTDVRTILSLIKTKSATEQKADEIINSMGGLDVVIRSDENLDELARKLGERIDTTTKRMARGDLDEALKANFDVFLLRMDHLSHQLQDSVDASTRTILLKLDAGPHEYIEDPDIKAVWQETGARTSAKTRVFLDAVHNYFSRKFLRHRLDTGEAHPDAWTLHFLSKVIFYPTIAEGIDEDSSGFVSVHEVDSFIKSKPSGINCSVAQWFAFWAAGPYKTDVEHQTKIQCMLSDLEKLAEKVLPINQKRVKYFCSIKKNLELIDVYDDVLGYLGESETGNSVYESLERLRVAWRNVELQRIKANLKKTQYRLKGSESVLAVTDGRRLEHSAMALIYLLLRHHLKVVKLATTQTVSVAEFEDMRESWNYLFDAFDQRLDILKEIWRQQRLNVEIQVASYAGGLFESLYQKNEALNEADESSDYDGDDSDYDYSTDDEAEDAENAAGGDAPDHDGVDAASDISKREMGSVISSAVGHKKEKETLLLYPVPAEPEDEDGLTTSDESEWEPPAVKKRKNDAAVRTRLEDIETKLVSIEDMLNRLLAANTGHPNQPSATETYHTISNAGNIEQDDDDDEDNSDDGTDEDDD